MDQVNIELGAHSYKVLIGYQLLQSKDFYEYLPKAEHSFIVTNKKIESLYANSLCSALEASYKKIDIFSLPDGESYKNWQSLNLIFDALLGRGCDRKTILFALGGGVVGDITGFAAACYMRGISFVQVPTTLLAQVDSSVGGKTGINHPRGKNMLGAFWQPSCVLCDLDLLQSLPTREFNAGLAEIIKYGVVFDEFFLTWLEQNMSDLLSGKMEALTYAIRRSCEIKAQIVACDERESGKRAILNFGHTFAHAIEAGLGYGTWLHGEAVAVGMVIATQLSVHLNLVDSFFVHRLRNLLKAANLPAKAPVLDFIDNSGCYLRLMRIDKKSINGQIRFVLPISSGGVILRQAPEVLVRKAIEDCSV